MTDIVKSFYEENPFPNYQDHESVRSLIDKSRRGSYGHMLQQAIPFNSTLLAQPQSTGLPTDSVRDGLQSALNDLYSRTRSAIASLPARPSESAQSSCRTGSTNDRAHR